jgi:hypothetical protein
VEYEDKKKATNSRVCSCSAPISAECGVWSAHFAA